MATAVRIGVDVGGTFTKAVAVDASGSGASPIAEASIATTHDHDDGVAAGVLTVIGRVAEAVGPENVVLVTHSTTQAVNALLEGDVGTVGVIGMGRAPDLRKAQQRTAVDRLELHPGRHLPVENAFLDVTEGLDEIAAGETIDRLQAAGARSIAVAEAFAPDDQTNEAAIAGLAAERGLPVTTSTELSGLYGLELRTITAALNASVLPIAARTARVVADGVRQRGIDAPVLVMRGDGGATDLAGFTTAPARTLYSGPAASVAGALRSGPIDEGVIVEVGGTSSNVAAISNGRPALSYVQVGNHATAIRALDVRVVGVAGGSMLRVRRNKVYGVGPRSAHIAGCAYSCFLHVTDLDGAQLELIAPRDGDPSDYAVVRLRDGRRAALTNTCAANALGQVDADDYAHSGPDAALAAFAIVGEQLRLPAVEVARRLLEASSMHLAELVDRVARDHHLHTPRLIAVGGGAGGLGRAVGRAMRLETVVPPHAEVISAIGDATSLIRVEVEQANDDSDAQALDDLVARAEAEAVAAGAAVGDLDVRVETVPERGSVRVVVSGAVALASGALPGRAEATEAAVAGRLDGARSRRVGGFWLLEVGDRVVVLDRYGDSVCDTTGDALILPCTDQQIEEAVDRRTKRVGPVALAPDAWVLHGNRATKLTATTTEAILAAAALAHDPLIVIGRS